jgi:hypothetical protein
VDKLAEYEVYTNKKSADEVSLDNEFVDNVAKERLAEDKLLLNKM